MTDGRASTYRIRQARPDELPLLPAIETAAAELFRQSAYAWIADEPNGMDPAMFAHCQDTWCLWVATDAVSRPVGFAAFAPEDDQIWLGELSVHPDHHRRGLGAALIDKAAGFYGPRGTPRMTLTTFRDVPWNAPYYARLGFAMIDDLSTEPFLAAQIEKEEGWGVPEGSRVAMQRVFGDTPSNIAGPAVSMASWREHHYSPEAEDGEPLGAKPAGPAKWQHRSER